MKKIRKKLSGGLNAVSLSRLITGAIMVIVMVTLVSVAAVFINVYRRSMEQNAVTTSTQAVNQVLNTVAGYTEDIEELMEMVKQNVAAEKNQQYTFFENLTRTRSEVVAVTTYDEYGNIRDCWAGEETIKEKWLKNLSYQEISGSYKLNISSPHVETLFKDSYPWVVTISEDMEDTDGEVTRVAMDIRFSSIANYVDDVGIGQHGYCFIMDDSGSIIYHPQQQLLYSGLKEETTQLLTELPDGTHIESQVLYTLQTLDTCGWRIVGVCYTDEMIGDKVSDMMDISLVILGMVLVLALGVGSIISAVLSNPSRRLARAMEEFEKNAENFKFEPVGGTREINQLSDSFGHMVLRIQQLMEKVRQEEITLRKTELNALQAQINPHFLYNTLSSIEWMCEEGRSEEAVEMVDALGQLFRISISKGHELITIEKELQHARSYLKIQNFRYKNQFSYEFDVEDACLPYLCNKITLQPIIENAIYHGIDRMVDEGHIEIGIHQTEDDIIMTVEDNGVGMSREQCREILKRESGDKSGIGIKNVNDRIRIYFGEQYGISITSEPDEGTRVEIRMPKIREEQYEERK